MAESFCSYQLVRIYNLPEDMATWSNCHLNISSEHLVFHNVSSLNVSTRLSSLWEEYMCIVICT